jgi:hypothetical protein
MGPGSSTRTCSDYCDHSRGSECWEPSTKERIGRWLDRHLVKLTVVGAVGLGVLAGLGVRMSSQRAEAKYQKFHTECIQHRKEFECAAMWRAGNTDTVVVPVIVPVGR